jgi:hypothetical protein
MLYWTEPAFATSVSAEMAPSIKRIPDVKGALLNNALDSKREDQWIWMKRFEAMTGKHFLPDDE